MYGEPPVVKDALTKQFLKRAAEAIYKNLVRTKIAVEKRRPDGRGTEEIRQITAFFDSPTGRKLSTLGPTLLEESRRPGAGNVLPNHFDAAELAEIAAFWSSPVGRKMNETAERIREDMHAHFIERSEPALQAVARELANKAELPAAAANAAD